MVLYNDKNISKYEFGMDFMIYRSLLLDNWVQSNWFWSYVETGDDHWRLQNDTRNSIQMNT